MKKEKADSGNTYECFQCGTITEEVTLPCNDCGQFTYRNRSYPME